MTPASWLARLRQQYLTPVTLIRLVPISVVLVTGLVLTTWTHGLLSQHRDLVLHTHEVIETAKDVLIGLDDAETGQRGFLLSNESATSNPTGARRTGWMPWRPAWQARCRTTQTRPRAWIACPG